MFPQWDCKMLFLIFILTLSVVHSHKLDGCDAIPASLTAPKTGQKAWDKCIEYQERFVHPCENVTLLDGMVVQQRGNYCEREPLILTNSDTKLNGHVVSLGYGSEADVRWLCGGTIISDRHILTAGHCMRNVVTRESVSSVYLGPPVKTEDIDKSKLYKIKSVTLHPEYKAPIKYNDIAIIETEGLMKLNGHLRPACLHTGEPLNYEKATLLSRNFGETGSQNSDEKILLTGLSNEECLQLFPIHRLMRQGYLAERQMCYEDKSGTEWSRRFDSGSPLQVKSDKIDCMEVVIGVTSLGKSTPTSLTVFTRVAHYLPWIESIVWP